MKRFWILIALAGCLTSDDDVAPSVTHASIEARASSRDTLASIDIGLELQAGPSADRTVLLDEVYLASSNTKVHDLAVAWPASFSPVFGASDLRATTLVNLGTSNGELLPYCGTPLVLVAKLAYVDDTLATFSPGFDVTVACP